jgi:hypothetical protein
MTPRRCSKHAELYYKTYLIDTRMCCDCCLLYIIIKKYKITTGPKDPTPAVNASSIQPAPCKHPPYERKCISGHSHSFPRVSSSAVTENDRKNGKLAETQLIRLLKDGPMCRPSPERQILPQPKPSDSITLQAEGTTICRNAGHNPPDDVNNQQHSCNNIKFRELRLKPGYSSLQA